MFTEQESRRIYESAKGRTEELFGWCPENHIYNVVSPNTVAGLSAISDVFGTIYGPLTEGVKELYREMSFSRNTKVLEFVSPGEIHKIFINAGVRKNKGVWETLSSHAFAHVYQFEEGSLNRYTNHLNEAAHIDRSINSFLDKASITDSLYIQKQYKSQFSRDILAILNILARSHFDETTVAYWFDLAKVQSEKWRDMIIQTRGRTFNEIIDYVYPDIKKKWELLEKMPSSIVLKEGWASYCHEKFYNKYHPDVKEDLDPYSLPPQYGFGMEIFKELEMDGEDPEGIALKHVSDKDFFSDVMSKIDMDKVWKRFEESFSKTPGIAEISISVEDTKKEEKKRKYTLISTEGLKHYFKKVMKSEEMKYPVPIRKITDFISYQGKRILTIQMNSDIVPWLRDEELYLILHLYHGKDEVQKRFPDLAVLVSGNIIDDYSVGIKNLSSKKIPLDPYHISKDMQGFAAHFLTTSYAEYKDADVKRYIKDLQSKDLLPGQIKLIEKAIIFIKGTEKQF